MVTSSIIFGVFYLKDSDKELRRVGINRDEGRRSQSRIQNEAEQILQLELRKKLEEDQKVK